MHLPPRHCLILQGENDWLTQQALQAYQQAGPAHRCWLSDSQQRPAEAISSQQALQQLGQNKRLVIFDAREHFSADAFGALIGTLEAGGWMLILLPAGPTQSLWLQRFLSRLENYPEVQKICQGEALPSISYPPATESAPLIVPTPEQTQAIQAVLHVVSGHRRRPLLIVSDRGRGKTTLLGMAAAALLKQGKTRILVTAPASRNIQALLEHAALSLTGAKRDHNRVCWQQGEIRFMAPDALLADKPAGDLLMIDEAAAIPSPMLENMLQTYSRLVFATTEHGYEGTGRGFTVRFKRRLDYLAPGWRAMTIKQPVRWAVDDGLERFSFDALLLDAEPAGGSELSRMVVADLRFQVLDKQQLAKDEALLREVFGLMVLAHYRTRPSDLQLLLDRDDISVLVLRNGQHILASAWLVKEPRLEAGLAQQVFDGRRRLKGQLLPQTLLAHSGVLEAGNLSYQRIVRIAVHPAFQGQGLGSQLLEQIHRHFADDCDVIGSSFALEPDLLRFWLKNAYLPVRIGQQSDEVSGQRAGIMLRAVSQAGEAMLTRARQLWLRDWPFQLLQSQSELAPELVVLLSQTLPDSTVTEMSADERRALAGFAWQQRAYESIEPLLWRWLQTKLVAGELTRLAAERQAVLVKKIIQAQSFSQVARSLQLTGRKAVIEQLRLAVAELLEPETN
jgi:tRNA(Met) cytidine acetyltransferase